MEIVLRYIIVEICECFQVWLIVLIGMYIFVYLLNKKWELILIEKSNQ